MKKSITSLSRLCLDAENEILKNGLLSDGEAVLVALSGGADSVALLYVLKFYAEKHEVKVCAFHVNHGIRGDEADRDENFCRELCEKLSVPFKSVKLNVPAECEKSREGLEECARRLRYRELENAAHDFGCAKIATAHHADDNIETVLLHLSRGCGLRGMIGIPMVRGNIIRPLLAFSKPRITDALESENIPCVYDSTNSDLDMSRNLIRHTVLPQLYKLNPSLDAAFRRMSESVSEDEVFIENAASAIPERADRAALAQLDNAVLSRFIRRKFQDFGGGQIEREQMKQICSELHKNSGSSQFVLTGGIKAHVDASGISFSKNEQNEDYFVKLKMGENIISSCGYKIFITTDKNVAMEWQNIYKLETPASVISDKILSEGEIKAYVRPRRSGDRYVFGGMGRNVRRQMINFHIPPRVRNTLPVFCTEAGEIFYIPGLPLADAFRPSNSGGRIYIFCIEK